ncbi:MAG TPA: GLUG motif-containing protein, partial [Bacteroidota bacterium]
MKTNTFAFAMTLLFVLVTTTTVGQTATAPSGSGTTGDPYQIATLDNLYWVTQNSTSWNKHFLQTADIDASSDTSWDSNQGFSPIGTAGVNFTGVYDGGGHTISGLFISRSSANNLGMFGIAYYPDTVKNLGLTNVNITGGTNTGGLVASNSNGCTILNCYTTGSVNATYSNYIGGLVGYNNGSVVSNCFSTVNVSVNSASSNIGGLVGYSRGQSTINNCYATGSVNGGASYAGGLVGYNITNGASPVALISNSYSLGKVTGSSPTGALVGQNDAAVDSCFWNKDSSGTTGIGAGTTTGATGKTTVQMKDPATFTAAGWDTASWYMGDGINNGYAYLQWQYPGGIHLVTAVAPSTSGGSYLIASLDNLYWVSQNSSSWGSSFLQTADIDASQTSGWASGSGFTPIGKSGSYFSGTYNGNGHTISNLWISRGSTSAVGLFGFPKSGATIENLGVVNANIRGSGYVGALVGDNDGTVSNCYSTGSVSGSNLVGGLIGGIVSGSASNSYSTASVSGGSSVGGLVGYLLSASVSDCYSTGSVSGGSSTGGLIGSNSGSVSNSFWDTQTSGQSGGSGTGETTATMKTQSTFTGAGWDFANTWAIDPGVNNGYPALIWQSDFPAASPTITTNAASSVHFTSAMLNGTVNPFKGNTTVNFVYGTVSGSYPDTVAASQSPVNGWTGVSVSAQVSGLTTNQTYYFRAIATSSYGSSAGSE